MTSFFIGLLVMGLVSIPMGATLTRDDEDDALLREKFLEALRAAQLTAQQAADRLGLGVSRFSEIVTGADGAHLPSLTRVANLGPLFWAHFSPWIAFVSARKVARELYQTDKLRMARAELRPAKERQSA